MELRIAIAKIDRHGSSASGDTVEVTERPNGGISVVLADGQIDQIDQKSVSTMVSHRVIEYISQGIRDSAAIRMASNNLFTEYQARVQARVNVISVDFQTNTILISRNNPIPIFLINEDEVDCLANECDPIGGRADISPSIVELPITPGMAIVVFSDGVYNAGQENEDKPQICTIIEALVEEQEPSAREMADFLLNRAIRLDEGRPQDDMSVIVLLISPQETDLVRRMSVSMSLDEIFTDSTINPNLSPQSE
jgi:serine phosphatase RsbU (regulator of sigma subunit)